MNDIRNPSGNGLSASFVETNMAVDYPAIHAQMVATAAYFIAEERGFAPNNELGDWFEAEREIETHLISFSS